MDSPGTTTSRQAVLRDDEGQSTSIVVKPAVALLAAGAIGFAVGAVIWKYRKGNTQRFGSFDRAIDIARSGTVDTVQKLRRRLEDEGYSPAQLEGRAKKYLAHLIDIVQRRA